MHRSIVNSIEDISEVGRIIGDRKDYMLAVTSQDIRHIYCEESVWSMIMLTLLVYLMLMSCRQMTLMIEDVICEFFFYRIRVDDIAYLCFAELPT